MKINYQNSLVYAHQYAQKRRDWFKCAQFSREANELYFRSFMSNMVARRVKVSGVFFGWNYRTEGGKMRVLGIHQQVVSRGLAGDLTVLSGVTCPNS